MNFSSLNDFRRRHLGESRPPSSNSVEDNLRRAEERLARAAEQPAARRKIALELISAGYKALAIKLHPDKGGSREAMILLNEVRDLLKRCVP